MTNTISFYMHRLRAVYNKAVDQELIEQKYPFKQIKIGIEKTIMSCVNSIYGDIEYEYDVNLSDPRIIITEDGEDALLYIALITIKWPYGNSYIGKHEEMSFIVL